MPLTRNDRIWLVRVLIIGSLLLTVVNLIIFGIHYKNRQQPEVAKQQVSSVSDAKPEKPSVSIEDNFSRSGVRLDYSIFRGRWKSPSLNPSRRGI